MFSRSMFPYPLHRPKQTPDFWAPSQKLNSLSLSLSLSPTSIYQNDILKLRTFICTFLKTNCYLFYPITLEGRRGTTDEFATIKQIAFEVKI